jgi:hypothetical protein
VINPAYPVRTTADVKIEPGTEPYYNRDADFWITVALETIYEWNYEWDPHGYCHERSVLVGLLREIERLRG